MTGTNDLSTFKMYIVDFNKRQRYSQEILHFRLRLRKTQNAVQLQNHMQKFRKSAIFFGKPGILSKNLKTLTSSNYPAVQYFLLKLRTRLDLELFYTLVFYIFINNSSLNKIKKSRPPFCGHYQIENMCKISAKNIKLYGSWSSSNFSIF